MSAARIELSTSSWYHIILLLDRGAWLANSTAHLAARIELRSSE